MNMNINKNMNKDIDEYKYECKANGYKSICHQLISIAVVTIVDQLVIVFSKDVCLSEVKLGVRVVIIIIRINELENK